METKTTITVKYLDENQILGLSQPFVLSKNRGIYFLIKENEIVYIGQSTDIESRIRQHPRKDFDSYSYVLVDRGICLDIVESGYIIKFQPKYNKMLPYTFNCVSESYLNKTRKGGPKVNARRLREMGIEPNFCLHGTRYFGNSVLKHFEVKPSYVEKIESGEVYP